MSKVNKQKKKSVFLTELEAARKNQVDKALPEEVRKLKRFEKLDGIFEEIANKQNRYLFYCPDIPFANSMVKIIYEYAYRLKNLGYNVKVLHEVKGFKPDWLDYTWKKEISVDYLQEKKNNKLTQPNYDFRPTDSIIIPDGFWTVMESIAQMRTVHKIVLALGYGGIVTSKPGLNWGALGFQDVICVSKKVISDYKSLWPYLNYYHIGYELKQENFIPLPTKEVKPIIGLMTRSREDAAQIINTFYAKYPFLDFFEFKILKKMSTNQYIHNLKNCCVLAFVDEQSGHPAPPLEALALDVPVVSVYGRGMEHLASNPNFYWVGSKDMFLLTEKLAEVCYSWMFNPTQKPQQKEILEEYSADKVISRLFNTFEELQQVKVKTFVAVKEAVEEGKLDSNIFDE